MQFNVSTSTAVHFVRPAIIYHSLYCFTRTTSIVSECAGNAADVRRPGAQDAVKSQCSNFNLYPLRHWQPMEDVAKTGVMCSCLPRPTTRRAAALSTICSRRMTAVSVPQSTALQQSTRSATNSVQRVSAGHRQLKSPKIIIQVV